MAAPFLFIIPRERSEQGILFVLASLGTACQMGPTHKPGVAQERTRSFAVLRTTGVSLACGLNPLQDVKILRIAVEDRRLVL